MHQNLEVSGRTGLPLRWCRRHGAIYYRVPDDRVYLWGKRWYWLGKTYDAALKAYYAKLDEIAVAGGTKVLTVRQITQITKRGMVMRGPVVYFLIAGDEIVYVGKSMSVAARIASHSDKDFERVATIACDDADLDLMEAAYISKFKPRYNTQLAGEGASDVYFA